MSENNYSWNVTLKFSWGHIVAIVALIFISVIVFMGECYNNGGDFRSALFKVALNDILLLIAFIGAQMFKGAEKNFDRAIIIERILICCCPIFFVLAMIPYNHFWTVFSERKNIEKSFSSTIAKSKKMFVDYDQYANERIASYDNSLQQAIDNWNRVSNENERLPNESGRPSNRDTRPSNEDVVVEDVFNTYEKLGFTGDNDATMKQIFLETLQLQLKSQNTLELEKSALEWIESANQGASIWNVFLIGNIKNISDAIDSWNTKLVKVSTPVLSNESQNTTPFDADKSSCGAVKEELKNLQDSYKQTSGIKANTVWTGIILFLFLLFPYYLQERRTKASGYYSLIPFLNRGSDLKPAKKHKDDSQGEKQSGSNNDIYSGTF